MVNGPNNERELTERIQSYGRCVVAFSGGVDSSVVAKAALMALGRENCWAVTAVSASLARRELKIATQVAKQIGIPHRLIETNEQSNPDYIANDGNRCFHCKSELYGQIRNQFGAEWTLLNGTNLDDLAEYRPGLKAAEEFAVGSPLAECQFSKADVRALAKAWKISVWDKPAAPCLASRVAYNESVDSKKLSMIEQAEDWLIENGFFEMRVRYHPDAIARVEVSSSDLPRLINETTREELVRTLKQIGFQRVTLDLEGFRSGNLNESLSLVQLGLHKHPGDVSGQT